MSTTAFRSKSVLKRYLLNSPKSGGRYENIRTQNLSNLGPISKVFRSRFPGVSIVFKKDLWRVHNGKEQASGPRTPRISAARQGSQTKRFACSNERLRERLSEVNHSLKVQYL